ncbi:MULTISPECIES: GNAT family N-acetyltransferase [Microbulbifer]|uniref:GNAT family N-acetyltransferase n=1 Tax=Microbulbifer salipaludis TaxID=187980 RepID=A0ABS3E8W0_9GAMM|nr:MULTISPECIES: GNAT family N-acetyltransferase [Microbulbifer]MBN8431702.1 GNAT family N-acetyltransferase [Microbulbifer salipaludis]
MDPDFSTDSLTAQWLSDAEMPLANKFYRTHKFRGKARRHDPCMVIRDSKNQIIACGSLRKLTDSQLLAGVAVAEEFQGRGVARLLLGRMAEAYDDHTFTFPYRHLVPFYQSLGYAEVTEAGLPSAIIDRFHTYQKQGRDIVLMHYQSKQ